ncbi:putative Late nodulin [Medicago truncatula]|uniref:Putative Late nodulin n=1 Tax=Medicago truncatula TaxID=3880 RepID=A0A396GZR9_MEDTR|nr:putative Late nodulin [Medicago truncatula]
MQRRRNMAILLKFVYIMIIYLFVVLVVVEGYSVYGCNDDTDCPPSCTTRGCPDSCAYPHVLRCIGKNCVCT